MDPHPGELSPLMTLPQFFAEYYLPCRLATRTDRRTIAEASTALKRWASLTGDPPLCRITNLVAARAVAAALDLPARGRMVSPNTVRKWAKVWADVLGHAGPQCRRFPCAAEPDGLFGDDTRGRPRPAPYFELPPKRDKLPTDSFTLEEIHAFIAAAEQFATKPAIGICSPATWWRSLIVFTYNTGMRIGSVLKLRREWLTTTAEGDGWFALPARAYKGGRPKLIYANRHAIEAARAIPTRGLLWPWPHTTKTLQECRRAILTAAGFPEFRRFGFHALRKACATALWRHNPTSAQTQLGHADLRTTTASYASPDVLGPALAEQLRDAAAKIPQP